jgi:hypothetical protein
LRKRNEREVRNMAVERDSERIKDLPKNEKDSSLTDEQLGGVAAGMREETGPMGARTNNQPETDNG